ncbi:MAG: hypothetical protein ACRDCT_18460 [Shewanella sp.]
MRERSTGFQPVRSSSGPSPRRRRSRLDSGSSPLEFDSRIPRYVHRPSLLGQSPSGAGSRHQLGALDRVIGDPAVVTSALPPAFKPSPHKVAAILGESNHLELQRHLLTSVVHNEASFANLRADIFSVFIQYSLMINKQKTHNLA